VSETVFAVDGLSVEFRDDGRRVRAVRGCSLSVDRGEILALVGESGCGKSVTALACLGLLPPRTRIEGRIVVAGVAHQAADVEPLADLRGGTVSMVFQNAAAALNPLFTIGDQVRMVIERHSSLRRAAARARVLQCLTRVALDDPESIAGAYPHQLSGGQLQRAMLALATCARPRVVIADEPTTALDVTLQIQVLTLLRRLTVEESLSVLFTHDLGVVSTLCDRVAVMYAGTVVETGPVRRVLERPAHPYTRALLDAVPSLGDGRRRLYGLPGTLPDPAALPEGCAFAPRCPKVSERCRAEPPLVAFAGDRAVACHHADA
jgi:peptide/nickel transport system ATP-binding protein